MAVQWKLVNYYISATYIISQLTVAEYHSNTLFHRRLFRTKAKHYFTVIEHYSAIDDCDHTGGVITVFLYISLFIFHNLHVFVVWKYSANVTQ